MSSEVVSAFIAGIFGFIVARRQDKAKYITNERSVWRGQIKGLMSQIHSASKYQISGPLAQLKLNLNPRGKIYIKDYMKDGHIWETMNALEEDISREEFEKKKKELEDYITLLLKFDWERSKKEVSGELSKYIVYLIWGLTSAYLLSMAYMYSKPEYEDIVLHVVLLNAVVVAIIMYALSFIIRWISENYIEILSDTQISKKRIWQDLGLVVLVLVVVVVLIADGASVWYLKQSIQEIVRAEYGSMIMVVSSIGMTAGYAIPSLNIMTDSFEISNYNYYINKIKDMHKEA